MPASKRSRPDTPQPPPTFAFAARWREELVCTAAGGSFVLELTMGSKLTVYLPTDDAWQARAPDWARPLWPMLHAELEAWCRKNDARLVLDPGAAIY